MTARIERCSGRTIARKDTANYDPKAKLIPNANSSSHSINRWMVTRREEMAPMGDLTKRYKPKGTKRRPASNTKPGMFIKLRKENNNQIRTQLLHSPRKGHSHRLHPQQGRASVRKWPSWQCGPSFRCSCRHLSR